MEPTQRSVIDRHRSLTLEHMNLDGRLTVRRRREDLALLCRDRRIGGNHHGRDTAERLDAERKRGNIEKEHIRHVAGKNAPLDSSPHCDNLVRIDALVSLSSKHIFDQLLHAGDARHPTDQNHFIDLARIEGGISQCLLDGRQAALDQIFHKLLELRPGQRHVQMFRTVSRRRNEGEIDLRLHQL